MFGSVSPCGLQAFGRLRVERSLGRGMAGEVFLTRDPVTGERFVVKQLRVHAAHSLDRFRREARLLRRLDHLHVMPVVHVSTTSTPPYYVMPYRPGNTVADRLAETGGRLSVSAAVSIARDACRALVEIHDLGIVHRDVKPGNLFLDSSGRTLLLDFGLAKELESPEALTATGAILGTPAYMSPEQCRGERVDGRADVYALGVTLFELVSGRNPFASTDLVETLRRQLEETPRRLDGLAPHRVAAELGELVERMLAKAPERRPTARTCLAAFSAEVRRFELTARAVTTAVARPGAGPAPAALPGAA